MSALATAAEYLRREYTLETGTARDERATQAATPCATEGYMSTGGAVNVNATEALRGPVSSLLPAVGGADEVAIPNSLGAVLRVPTENAPGEQATLET